ncbi:MAG: hypothetical protein R3F20_00360 [Planctomycetota bacterium]
MSLNRFLVERGWLSLRRATEARSLQANLRTGEAFAEVDWSRTRAYAMGLGKIYLNLEGREPHGIVSRDESTILLAEIETALRDLRDEGAPVVSSLARGAEIYPDGVIPGGAADLYVGFHRGWRVSLADRARRSARAALLRQRQRLERRPLRRRSRPRARRPRVESRAPRRRRERRRHRGDGPRLVRATTNRLTVTRSFSR